MTRIISILMALVWVVRPTNQANAGVHILRKIRHNKGKWKVKAIACAKVAVLIA